jgi:hypothetical protein
VAPAFSHLAPDAGSAEAAGRWIVALAGDDRALGRQGLYRLPGGGLALVQQDPFRLESFAPDHGLRLVATPAGFAAGDLRAHPGALALAAWLAGPSTQVLHVGAVAFSGCGVLLVGPGGAGKTTSVLACALAGGEFLGDDLCLVEIGDDALGPAMVHSLFSTVKLNADSARRLGAENWVMLGMTPKDKVAARLPASIRTAASAPIGAIVVLAPPGSDPPTTAALRPAQAVAAIAATGASLACVANGPAPWFGIATRLARRVPTFRLPIAWDLEGLADSIRRIAEAGAGGRRP